MADSSSGLSFWRPESRASLRPTLGFIGAGVVGSALALALEGVGYRVVAVASRSYESASRLGERLEKAAVVEPARVIDLADLIVLSTPDDAIEPLARSLPWREDRAVCHLSGVATANLLTSARQCGALVGVFHPLQTFASVEGAIDALPGTTFTVESEEPLLSALFEMARSLGGIPIRLQPEDKVLYHVAAVMASNYLVTLVKLATDLWGDFDQDQETALRALLPLLRGTIGNLERVGLPRALTGPIARGDIGTIKRHLDALDSRKPDLKEIYQRLGMEAIPIAQARGTLSLERAVEMERLLKDE